MGFNKVAVLLSTYNGEKYVGQLIDSLKKQTYKNFCVYIRDDGSTDSTISVVKKSIVNDTRFIFVEDNLHLGPAKTFLHLLQIVNSDYYMFCDQDDVWLENKIELSIKGIQELEKSHQQTPILLYTDLIVTDGNLNIISPSLWEYSHMNVHAPTSYNYICLYNNIPGCTSIINNTAKECVNYSITLPANIYHDWWVAICVSKAKGLIIPLEISTILFRRHGDNETTVSNDSRDICAKMQRIKESYLNLRKRYSFFKSIGYGPFIKYFYYKVVLSIKYGK